MNISARYTPYAKNSRFRVTVKNSVFWLAILSDLNDRIALEPCKADAMDLVNSFINSPIFIVYSHRGARDVGF